MKLASEDLIDEHFGILHGLDVLEIMIQHIQAGKPVEKADLTGMVDFFKLFADKCHHGKEEGYMFPAMEEFGVPRENGPIGQMLIEHDEGRQYIARMTEATLSGVLKAELFEQNASAYIRLLRAHIDKENKVLFPLGDKLIPLEKQHELLEAFEEHELRVMGAGTHEKLHETLHAYQMKYKSHA